MAENSKIEWTHHTFNPWVGCTKVHEGCKHCYAEADFDTRRGFAKWGLHGSRTMTSVDNWKKPLKWNRDAECSCGASGSGGRECAFCAGGCVRPLVFCASLADVFEDWDGPIFNSRCSRVAISQLPSGPSVFYGCDGVYQLRDREHWATLADMRRMLFDVIDRTPNLDWLLLTKRPENIPTMMADLYPVHTRADLDVSQQYRDNVWLGTSISTQEHANKQIPELLKCRDLAPVLFLSCEPLLGPINLGNALKHWTCPCSCHDILAAEPCTAECRSGIGHQSAIDWVIAGGESGHNARPMHPEWARSLRDQCDSSGVPFLFKQWGEWFPWKDIKDIPAEASDKAPVCLVKQDGRVFRPYSHAEHAPGQQMVLAGKKLAGRSLDNRIHDEFPIVTVKA